MSYLKGDDVKQIILPIALSLLLVSPALGDDIQTEAVDSLGTAQKFITDGNYNKAIEEINYALAKINELTAIELLTFIPEPPTGFTLTHKQSQGVGAAASIAGNAGATAEYNHADGATIQLNIAIGGMTGKMASFAALGSIFAGLSQDANVGQSRKVRVQGYTGTELYHSNNMTGTLTFQIGETTSVSIEGTNIESPDSLMQLAKKIDFAGIGKTF